MSAEQEKNNGVLRAQYIRQACQAWMEKQKPAVLAKIRELALEKYPKAAPEKPSFELDKELASLK